LHQRIEKEMKTTYSVKQLAKLAGISVRTLHVYDQVGLLKPALRTTAGYRQYGEAELLRLQQILFYKELDFPLKEIGPVLNQPDFNLINALEGHKQALAVKKNRLDTLLNTIDKTINHLKNKTMTDFEELYEGIPKDQADAWRQEAINKWGEETILKSENASRSVTKAELEKLKSDQKDINLRLREFADKDPHSNEVQVQIARHYHNICRFWGTDQLKPAAYKGLADLYVSDERYMAEDGKPNPAMAAFMRDAMVYYAETAL
jgi:DNA-binding transcriptional MerR regulator